MTFRPQKKPALTLDASLVQDDLPLEVIPKVFIGSIHAAFNAESLHHYGITHILNASRLPITFPKLFTYLSVEIRDRDSSNILACIPTTNIFIEAGLENGGVLVHCFGGKSRSAAFVCAYIMSSLGWSFEDAYSTVKAARSIVDINAGFECQLRAYHAANCDVYVAQQLLLRTRVRALYKQRGLGLLGTAEPKQSPDSRQQYSSSSTTASNSNEAKVSPNSDNPGSQDHNQAQNQVQGDHSMEVVTGESSADSCPVVLAPTLQLPTLALRGNNSNSSGTRSGPPSISTDTRPDLHSYDSFTFGAMTAMTNKSGDSKSGISIPRLATQTEDEGDFTFSKTRSISDVYEGGSDPMEEGNSTLNAPHEEDDPSALLLLERKLHYIADSPSNATGLGALAGFGALSTNTPISNSAPPAAGLKIDHKVGLNICTAPALMTTADRSGSEDSFSGTSNAYAEYAAGLGSTALSTSAAFMQGSGSSSGNRTHRASAGGNRGKGGKGRKGGRTAEVDPGHPACRLSRPGSTVVRVIPPLRGLERQFRCSWCNTALFTTANVLRTDVDFRALLEAFTVSSAAVLGSITMCGGGGGANASSSRTTQQQREGEEEYLAQEKHRFSSSSDYQQQQSQHHQIQHQQYAHGDFKQDGHTAYYDRPSSGGAGAGAGGSTVPILSRTHSGTGSGAKEEASSPPPSTLPPLNLSCEKGANISPLPSRRSDAKFSLSRTASKEDVYGQDTSSCKGGNASPNQPGAASGAAGGSGGGGRFPPIMLNRSRSGSQQNLNAPPTSGRNLSGSNLNTNHNFNTGSSSSSSREESKGTGEGDEMDVDSSSPPRHGGNYERATSFGSQHSTSDRYDGGRDHDYEASYAAPKMVVPSGGMRTTRAGLSKAFDFDIAMDEDNGGGGSATSHATSSSTAAGTGVSTSTGTSVSVADSSAHTGMGLGLGQSLGISLSSVSEGNITFDGSRRNSHSQVGAAMDDSAVLGYGSGKCSTPGSAKGSTTGSGKSTHGGGGGGGGGGERSRHNSLGVALPTLMHSRTSPMVSSTEQSMLLVTPRSLVQAQQSAQMAVHGAHSSSIPALAATPSAAAGSAAGTAAGTPTHTSPRGGLDNPAMHRGNLKVATNISLLGIAAINTSPAGVVHAAGSNTSTAAAVLLGTTQVHSPHSASTMSSGRSEDTPSPRIHIPPHRLQQQMGLLNTNFDGVSPRSQSLFQQYPRPQSAEKRRWLDRMNLLRGGGTGGGSGGGSGAGNMHDASSVSGLGNAIHCEHIGIAGGYYPSSSTSGGGSGGGSGADYKVVRMAEADDAASLLVYGGPEKYFHIEYMEWMGNAPFQAGVDTGDICCSSCKNTLGTWIWNPSSRMTLGNKLEAPLFRVHKHVVHQEDVPFDATPSSTPRMDEIHTTTTTTTTSSDN